MFSERRATQTRSKNKRAVKKVGKKNTISKTSKLNPMNGPRLKAITTKNRNAANRRDMEKLPKKRKKEFLKGAALSHL